MAVEQHRYTPQEEQAAKTFFEGLIEQPSLTKTQNNSLAPWQENTQIQK